MSTMIDGLIEAHPISGTPGVQPVKPSKASQAHLCELPLNIGVFFDGTGNNQDWVEPGQSRTQLQRHKDSNVARLFRSYREDALDGHFRVYVPGVGTPFPQIGEEGSSTLGMAFGAGGDGRINFALLGVMNAIHRSISPNMQVYAEPDAVKALCRNGKRSKVNGPSGDEGYSPLASHEDEPALRSVNMADTGGLLLDSFTGKAPQRVAFFKRACANIAAKMASVGKPKITEIFFDVYGFSRGAAEARVFTNWLLDLFEGNKLCGVRATIRFIGLFDTVASVGLPASFGLGQNGHRSWAQPEWLQIRKSDVIKNCVHYAAMHENRGSFPLELLRVNGELPKNCHEYMFPGMHSDVGGGYAPDEQGRGPGRSNAEKLSQMPLQAMYEASLQALVPLKSSLAAIGGVDAFEVNESLKDAFIHFMAPRQEQRPVREWMFEYLTWRYQARNQYMALPWAQRASKADHADLEGANALLIKDADALRLNQELSAVNTTDPFAPQANAKMAAEARVGRMRDEAPEIYKKILDSKGADDAAAHLFGEYCHDSYAGFKPFDKIKVAGWRPMLPWEPEGYFRWRRRYEGDDRQLTQVQPAPAASGEPARAMAASSNTEPADLQSAMST